MHIAIALDAVAIAAQQLKVVVLGLLGLDGLLARPALVRLFLGGALESALLLSPFDRRAHLLVGHGRLAPLAAARPEAVHALCQVLRGPCP